MFVRVDVKILDGEMIDRLRIGVGEEKDEAGDVRSF